MASATRNPDREFVSIVQRFAELAAVVPMSLLLVFFAYHQLTNTGFFTTRFGSWEMVALYGPVLLSLTAPLARAFSGRRNPARPYEVASNLALAVGSLWLLVVFPFDFIHLGDFMPDVVRFFLSFITNGISMLLLVIQIIGATITAVVAAVKYFSFRPLEGTI